MSLANTTLTDQECGWINDVASRLRLIQTDTSQLESKKRCEFLQEEIERSLKNVPAANRKRFVEALLARFPVAGNVVSSLSPAPEPLPPPAPAPVAESPEQILERLLASLPQLSEEKRHAFARRMFDSELLRPYRGAFVLEIPEALLRELGVAEGQQPRLDRMVPLMVLLLDVISRLDQTTLRTMEALSPRSPLVRRKEDIRRSTGRFLAGEVETLEAQKQEVFSLIAALLVAPLKGCQKFGQAYVQRFSPTAIEDVVDAQGSGTFFGRNKKERCWDHYCLLARDYATADLVDRKLKEFLVAAVQRVLEANRPA